MTKLRWNSAAIKHSVTGTLLALGLLMTGTSQASAATIRGTLTADNHYGLYHGQADGSGLTFVGRNEKGDVHVSDTTAPVPLSPCSTSVSWKCPEVWEFNTNQDDRLYVVAWDDHVLESWIGEFLTPDGLLLSNASDWEYTIGGLNPSSKGDVPLLTDLTAEIASATWFTPRSIATNGNPPWGTIKDISESAEFIWSKASNDRNYMIFRTKESFAGEPVEPEPVPETASILGLLALGGLGVASKLRKSDKRSRS